MLPLKACVERHPFGPANPTFFICDSSRLAASCLSAKQAARLAGSCFSINSAAGSSSTDASTGGGSSRGSGRGGGRGGGSGRGSKRVPGVHVQFGLAVDKQLCFCGSTSIAVLGSEPWGLELALAGLTVAMRETHRSSGSTMLWQLSQLQPCPLLPEPPPGSYLLQLMRVSRPLLLPSPRFKMLLAEGDSSVAALTHAVVWRLIHGLGCASVLVRGSEGVGAALAAVARARHTLRKLYKQDCVVYVAWKSAPAAAGAAVTDPGSSSSSSSSSFGDSGSSDGGSSSKQQPDPLPQLQSKLLPPMPGAVAPPAQGSVPAAPYQEQHLGSQPLEQLQPGPAAGTPATAAAAADATAAAAAGALPLPRKLYKLVVMSCDVSDPLAGWKHTSPHRRGSEQQQRWLLQAQEQMEQRQRQRQQQTRAKRLRWFRLRRSAASTPQQPPS